MRQILQSLAIFMLVQFAMKQFMGSGTSVQPSPESGKGPIPAFGDRPTSFAPDVKFHNIPENIAPMWSSGIPLDLNVYVSPSIIAPSLNKMPKDSLVLQERGFGFGDSKDKRTISTSFPVPVEVQNSGTLWAHFFVAQAGAVLDPKDSKYDTSKAYHFVRPFTQTLPKKKVKKTRNLLASSNETEVDIDEDTGPLYASFYHPNFTLSFIPDGTTHHYPSMHPSMRSFVHLESTGARDESRMNGWDYPTRFLN